MRAFKRAALGAAFAALCAGHGGAQEIGCDEFYTTRDGDNLSKIAQAASGSVGERITYQDIVDYNTGKLLDPNLIPTGLQLFIPCPVGSAGGAPPTQDSGGYVPPTSERGPDIRILTGLDYAPYVDEGLPGGGGWSVHLVDEALGGSGRLSYRIDFIGDWSAHLWILLADGAYDMAFPWFKPDCDRIDELGEEGRRRCNELLFSEPLHQVVISYFVRVGDAERIQTEADLTGLKICRPRGYFTHDLDVRGLSRDVFQRVAAASPTECFRRLMSGELDVVAINAETSERVIEELGIEDDVVEARRLATIESLHVVVMRDNERGRPLLLRFDQGLLTLREEGRDRAIASTHLAK